MNSTVVGETENNDDDGDEDDPMLLGGNNSDDDFDHPNETNTTPAVHSTKIQEEEDTRRYKKIQEDTRRGI